MVLPPERKLQSPLLLVAWTISRSKRITTCLSSGNLEDVGRLVHVCTRFLTKFDTCIHTNARNVSGDNNWIRPFRGGNSQARGAVAIGERFGGLGESPTSALSLPSQTITPLGDTFCLPTNPTLTLQRRDGFTGFVMVTMDIQVLGKKPDS